MSVEQLGTTSGQQPGLPLVEAIFSDQPYEQEAFERHLRQLHTEDHAFVGLMEIVVEAHQRLYLFIVQGELYAAARWREAKFSSLTLRRFFQLLHASFGARMTLWRADPILIKSLLVLTQKAPSLQTSSAVVKLDGLLQHLSQMHRDALLAVQEVSGLTLCYFLNGQLVFLQSSNPAWQQTEEGNEGTLAKIVEETAKAEPVPLLLFEDVNIHPAQDRDLLGDEWPKSLVEYFLTPRYALVLATEGGQEARVVVRGSQFSIGRGPDNDLVLSDPSVSRSHLLIRFEQGSHVAQDLESRNGTMVNGRAATSTPLTGGESLRLGEVVLRFIREEDEVAAMDDVQEKDGETTIVKTVHKPVSYQKTGLLGWLDAISGKLSGMRFELTQSKVLIGRTQGDVVIDDPKISREHGSVEWTADGFLYIDLGSTNGSLVNHVRVTSQLLKPGDVLRLGDTELRLQLVEKA
jgi:pSer/pThr/pTyr-binding forkhead associated (FHA) protein